MGGQEFEKILVEKILPIDGYTDLSLTSSTNDYGVDIIAFKDNIKCAIQCKRANNKVSNRAIQEITAGRKHYKCDKAIVITNNYYTENAKRLAFDNKVEILDRDYIIRLLKKNAVNKFKILIKINLKKIKKHLLFYNKICYSVKGDEMKKKNRFLNLDLKIKTKDLFLTFLSFIFMTNKHQFL